MEIFLQIDSLGGLLFVDYLIDVLLVGGVINCDANAAKRGFTWKPLSDCPSVIV